MLLSNQNILMMNLSSKSITLFVIVDVDKLLYRGCSHLTFHLNHANMTNLTLLITTN
mgnify:FL=1